MSEFYERRKTKQLYNNYSAKISLCYAVAKKKMNNVEHDPSKGIWLPYNSVQGLEVGKILSLGFVFTRWNHSELRHGSVHLVYLKDQRT